MVMAAFKKIFGCLIELVFRRVFVLVIVAWCLSTMLINDGMLKVKTINFLLPTSEDIRALTQHPEDMNPERLKEMLTYYSFACRFLKNSSQESVPCSIAGYVHYYLGNEKKAIKSYQQAVKLNEDFFWFHYNLGVIYFNQERYMQASEAFSQALSLQPDRTLYSLVLTKSYTEIAALLILKPADFAQSLYDGYQSAKKLYIISRLYVEQPDTPKNTSRQKLNLRLF